MAPKIIKRIIFIISLLLLTIFLTNRIFFFNKSFIENWASTLTYPVITVTSYITSPIKNIFNKRRSYKEIKSNLEKTKEENEALVLENLKLKETLRQTELSDDLIKFQERYDLQNKIFTKILVKNITSQEHYFLINKGSRDGVKKDMAAIYKFQLVGKVVDVNSFYSKILLITDKNCKVSVFANNTGAQGIIVGKNKINKCDMAYVSHLSKLENDDLIISSGQGLIFPEGFCLGTIKKFRTCGLYHKVRIEPLIDLNQIKYCLLTDQEKMSFF